MLGGPGPGPTSVVVDEGAIARPFWIKFRSDSVFALYSPFVLCLASGDLNSNAFLHFVSQDVHFLKAFALAYELAEDCADDDDDKSGIRDLRKRVVQRLKSHDTLVREWGFELPDEKVSSDATVKYTDFLLAAASGRVQGENVPGKIATPFERTKVAAYILGAIAPCMRLYSSISREIQAVLVPADNSHIYKKWLDSYSSKTYEEFALQVEDMVDKLSISLTGEELKVIEKLYYQAIKLEVDFFATQPISQQTIVPLARVLDPAERRLTIFCDFDLTCTAFDSSAILAEIAIITAPKANSDGSETQLARMSSADLRSTWGVLSTQYTEEFEQCIESIMDSRKVENFNYEGLNKALEQVAEFEKRANTRVVDSGVLKGLHLEDIKRAGQRLILQEGCRGFFQKIVKNDTLKTVVHVLSYSWCGDLIRSAFSSAGDLDELKVHANELIYEESMTTGDIVMKVESPMEKLQDFNDILNECNSEGKHLTVYIGGSVGDLLCLLQADIGIVIGSSSSLRRLGDHFGVSFVPLFSGLVKKQRELVKDGSCNWKGLSGILYTVSSWAEIHAFILGS
ncbi:bifunctional TH2 protein, mitochondrial-like isoform X1 [Juglans microcarpa x Juglans regia]|uniref:bifunctional TH2 protein, mitochondrial-like isoform X1 n=1 Tax=Juglans microcarpa x Juglans regia TaxID=2249226 RepID=UPI001B7EC1DB|nr:bifunctional TH2 protein, mitochondrial-like isoform X1 [Juglans microcarpa x Juglans regia]